MPWHGMYPEQLGAYLALAFLKYRTPAFVCF